MKAYKFLIYTKFTVAALFCSLLFLSCKKYLEAKPDKQLVIPESLVDAQALLDYYNVINITYPSIGALSDDDYYLTDAFYSSTINLNQNNYIWAKETHNDMEWANCYKIILYANMVLETTDKIRPDSSNYSEWKKVTGEGLFLRGYAMFHLAQYYAEPYEKTTASIKPGIPPRLTSAVTEKITRGSLEDTYLQITGDLKSAASLLPASNPPASRASRASAFGALARVYLTMGDYVQAGKYADSCLSISNTLLNYNTLDPITAIPFTRFNAEVIFQSTVLVSAPLTVTNWRVDTVLYSSYASNDLRKTIFFKSNGSAPALYFTWKGSYDATTSGGLFNGIATDEMYLVRAECNARIGNKDVAMDDLNALLVKRYKTATFVPLTATSPEDALVKILQERRKELTGRALRWIDLRRLNTDARFAKTLKRIVNGQQFLLPPGDPRYTEYIPQVVIDLTGIEQNSR